MNRDDSANERTVFVGGISPKATEEALKQFFESNFGEVTSSKIIYDRATGRSKGYGFVSFQNADTANQVRKSSGLIFLGKILNIGSAYRRTSGPRDEQGGGGGGQRGQSQQAAYPQQYGYYPYGYYPYGYYPTPAGVPGTAGDGSGAGGQMTAEQQAQMQTMLQAQMAAWMQMQQNPAAFQQLMAQFQGLSLNSQSDSSNGGDGDAVMPQAPLQVERGASSVTNGTGQDSKSSSSKAQ